MYPFLLKILIIELLRFFGRVFSFFKSVFLKITAICSAGVGNDSSDNREDSRHHLLGDSTDAMDCNVEMTSNSSKITAVLFVGISVDEVYCYLFWCADISGLL